MTDCAWTNPDIEADGFITPLEQLSGSKAKPATKCIYPECEACDKYHGSHCTVPVVFTKQMYMAASDWSMQKTDKLWELEARIRELEARVDVKEHLESVTF